MVSDQIRREASDCVIRGDTHRLAEIVALHPEIAKENWKEEDSLVWHSIWHNPPMIATVLALGFSPDERDSCNGTPLMHAAAEGMVPEMKLLLEYGADLSAQNDQHETPLGYAIAWDQLEAIRVLVQAGADPRAAYGGGTSNYIDFAHTGSPAEIIEYLESFR